MRARDRMHKSKCAELATRGVYMHPHVHTRARVSLQLYVCVSQIFVYADMRMRVRTHNHGRIFVFVWMRAHDHAQASARHEMFMRVPTCAHGAHELGVRIGIRMRLPLSCRNAPTYSSTRPRTHPYGYEYDNDYEYGNDYK